MVRYIELFAGVGGFRLGIEKAGEYLQERRAGGGDLPRNGTQPHNSVRKEGRDSEYATCVYTNEFDKYAAQTYNKNFGGQIDTRDITTVPTTDIPDHDLLVGGFPCQAFSVAGKRKGFDDTRGTLFFDIARILADKRPSHLVLENVKGLLSHDSGKTLQTIFGVLSDLGYEYQWQVLNSKDFGVPQNRERIFIVGHLRGQPRPQVFPLRPDSEQDIVPPTLTARYYGAQANGGYIGHSDGNGGGEIEQINEPKHSNDRVYGDKGIAPTLNTMQGGRRQPMIIQKSADWRKDNTHEPMVALTEARTPEAKAARKKAMEEGKDWSPRRGKELVPREDDVANTVTANIGKEQLIAPKVPDTVRSKIRRLTPIECERLQGFPDNWTQGVSDTQRYKQMGNAVTVNVVEAVMRRLYD